MKRGFTIIVNIIIITFIICFIVEHTSNKREDSNDHELQVFQNTAETAGQIIANYLEDEQHLCDIWASYINHYALDEGKPMTIEEAVDFTRRASISDKVDAHIIFYDDKSFAGLSRCESLKEAGNYSVSYKNYSLFSDFCEENLNNEIRQTKAFANPQNGVLSMAFLNTLTLCEKDSSKIRKALLMRIIPISELSRKLVYLKGEYEDVDLAIIDNVGNYMVHGSLLKNSNLFEYFKSYNNTNYMSQKEFEEKVIGETGLVELTDSKGRGCVVAHTPVTLDKDWFLINAIPKSSLILDVVDWVLLGGTIGALAALLIFNMAAMMLFNRRLAITAQEAKKANAAKSNFLSMMSHDIRTPMNAITGFNEMIGRESHDPNILRYSEAIRMAENTLLGLINDILDFSKLEAGKLDIVPVEYDLVNTLNDLVNMIRIRTDEKKLKLNVNISPDIPRRLYGDELRIKQCILNILSNAVKYTDEGSVTFNVTYESLSVEEKEILLKVSIADTGSGIKEEDIHKLFIAFKRLEESKNRNIEGTGLGISITQSLLTMMDSNLEVFSEYGKGSEFSFAVRQGVMSNEKVGDYQEAYLLETELKKGYRQSFISPSSRILVVDDTPLNISVFISLLKDTRMNIDTASSGAKALEKCTKNAYDMIFLDHMMPDMDGIETLYRMKEIKNSPNKDTPVICLTANAVSGMREMFLAEGFTDYLAKPIDYERLEVMLLKYLPHEKVVVEYIANDSSSDVNECINLPKGIEKVTGLDAKEGISHCESAESYLDTLKLYEETVKENSAEIRVMCKDLLLDDLTIRLHSLKSTSSIIGAKEISQLAKELERSGKDGTLAIRIGDVEKLLEMYELLGKELAKFFEPPKILLVDDDPIYLKMLRGWLSDKYQITAVKSGKQALLFLEKNKADLILLDYEMKDMNGSKVLEHLRENPATENIPVVFLTGEDDEETIHKLMKQNPRGYLLKSMDKETILQEIGKI
ncbi:response regulator [Butyrivibrio sp. NC3005]|uniref:response regulator n=1 Tax=Butyrivibrio sp. NC3005 TaxID=1280685 RepID=UPI0003F6F7BE|nr:response regulator [Butyrivibrio sp. NC3005]